MKAGLFAVAAGVPACRWRVPPAGRPVAATARPLAAIFPGLVPGCYLIVNFPGLIWAGRTFNLVATHSPMVTHSALAGMRRVFVAAIVSVAGLLGFTGSALAAPFTATYDFASSGTLTGTVDPTPVPVVANLTMGSFTAVGTPANPNAGGRFSFTNWPLGGVNANDSYAAHTGSINTGEYYSVTLTPQSGFALSLTSITFTVQRSGTGIRTYAVRASTDGYAANLPAQIDPANAALSVQAGNVFYVSADANTAATNGSKVVLTGPAFQNLNAPVTFRFYGFNAEASGGTFSIDNVVFTGDVSGAVGPTPPTINTAPASQTVTEGANVSFSVVAGGTGPFTYVWQKGGSPISNNPPAVTGANTDTLSLAGVTVADSGSTYNVLVTNAGGTTPSASATLTVNPAVIPASITSHPSPQSVVSGGTATFTVGAAGSPPLTYAWSKDGSPLSDGPTGTGSTVSGASSASLMVSGVGSSDVGNYTVKVTGPTNFVVSNPAALSLSALVTPTGQIAYVGGTYAQNFNTLPSAGTFTLTGTGPLALNAAPISATGLGGWSLAKYDGSGTVALFRVDAGSGTSGSVYSYGSAAAADRALGTISSGSTVPRFGAVLVNSTGRTITQFTLNYTGEQWRRGTSASPNKLTFEYSLGALDINSGDFVPAPSLDFTAPVTTGGGALDGNAAINRAAVAGTVSGISWAPGQVLVLRWSDIDDVGSDDGLAIDDLSFSTPVAANDILPAVIYTTPASGTVNIATNTVFSVVFNEAVNLAPGAFALEGGLSGVHAATIGGGPVTYMLTPSAAFAEGEPVALTVSATAVTDAATGTKQAAADYTAEFITFSSAPLAIHTIQGAGLSSPYANFPVTVQGIVVGAFQAPGGIGGYYLEAPDAQHDANPATSEGIYIFDNANSVTVGDLITVTGTVKEFQSSGASAFMTQTEITSVTTFTKVSTGNPLPTPAAVTLPFASSSVAEQYEGMLVTFPQTLTVNDNFDLGHFGEVTLANGRLPQPTNIVAPGAPAQAQAAANRLNQILLDDGVSTTYPSPTPFLSDANPVTATRRAGSTATGVTGILDTRFGLYVVEPTATPTFVEANPRPAAPVSAGSLRVVFGNVENFMNGDGAGGGFPTSRGAGTYAEFQRQMAKVTAAILNLAPDIMGISEMENDRITNGLPDSFGPTSALAQLVANLNANAPAGTTYAYINAGAADITTDLIHSVIIYRVETVEPVGLPAVFSNIYFNNHARNPIAQTFREKATGGKFTLCVNHFRAKAGPSSMDDGTGLNNDQGDGQGTNNYIRTREAQALTAWLATDPTGSGDSRVLIVGDLNAYSKEDPITAIESAGYINLAERFEGDGGYSYAFDGQFGHLDHALATPSLNAEVLSTATWHANSDEPTYYDYTQANKDATQAAINQGTPYRYADHDPVVIGLSLTAAPVITQQPLSQTVTVGDSVTFTVTATGTPAPTYQWYFNNGEISGATSASLTLPNPLTANAGAYNVTVTNSAGSVTSDDAILTVNKATAVVTLGDLAQTYTGGARVVSATTSPAGLGVALSYNGSSTPPVNVGTYPVSATVVDDNYVGSATGTLVVSPATAYVIFSGLNQTYDGTPRVVGVATAPAGLAVQLTYNGSAAAPVAAGSYAVAATVNDPNYIGSATSTLVVAPATATVTLGNLFQQYDGTPKPVTVTTVPAGLNVTLTYDGGPTAPTNPGAYAVVATVNEANYIGSASGTLQIDVTALVRHLDTVSGGIHGSVQVTTAEATGLNGNAWISGNLLVPGTPEVRLNGKPVYGGTNDGTGAVTPAGYLITLNGNSTLQHVIRRTDAIAIPAVPVPPAPTGTRDVTLNSAGQTAGDFATIRNLTIGGNAGPVAVPAGTYGKFTVGGTMVLGVAGATTPSVYNLQGLTLNGDAEIKVVGPVIVNVASGVALSGAMGEAGHPEWLEVNVANGGVTLNGSAVLDGYVTAPAGAVVINGNAVLNGGVVADRLTLNGKGALIEVD